MYTFFIFTFIFAEEDNYGCYARTLLKCFLAEGVASRHSLFLATAGEEPDEIWKVCTNFAGQKQKITLYGTVAVADNNFSKPVLFIFI